MSSGDAVPPHDDSTGPATAYTTGANHAGTGTQGRLRGALVLLVIGAGLGLGGYWVWSEVKDHIDYVAVGDCVRETPDDEASPYRTTPCADPAATDRVLELIPLDGPNCIDVAGAERSVTNDDSRVCLGDKDVDPAKAANVAAAGDCLILKAEAQRVDCSTRDAQYKVLKRSTNVVNVMGDGVRNACADVKGTVTTYSLNTETTGKLANISRTSIDVILCLGNA